MSKYPQATTIDALGSLTSRLLNFVEDATLSGCLTIAAGDLAANNISTQLYAYKILSNPANGRTVLIYFQGASTFVEFGDFPQACITDAAGNVTTELIKEAIGSDFNDALDTAQSDKTSSGNIGPIYIFDVGIDNGGAYHIFYFQGTQTSI